MRYRNNQNSKIPELTNIAQLDIKNLTKIKNSRKWVEVGPNETWIGAIDVKKYFLAIPHHENSQK